MQALQEELWALEGPRVHAHVGDLAWWANQHVGREQEWKRRLWLDGDRCVAWAWLDRPASLDCEVHSAHRGGELHEALLDWFEAEVEGDGPRSAFTMENDPVSLGLLERRGYRKGRYTSYPHYLRATGAPGTGLRCRRVLRCAP